MGKGDEDGLLFKGTRRKLDTLHGGAGQQPQSHEPSIGEEAGHRLRYIKNRCYRRSILKKWNKIHSLKS
jgi:hypothetical protein